MAHEHNHEHNHKHNHHEEHRHEEHGHEEHGHHHHHEEGGIKESIVKIAVATVLLIAAVFVEKYAGLKTWQLLLVFLVPYLVVGWETIREAAEGLLHGEALSEDFLMTIATLGAIGIGFMPGAEPQFAEAVFVMLFFQVGELFESIAEGRSRRSIQHLLDIRPDSANLERDGVVTVVSPETVKVGDVIVIRPGEKVPMDGVVIEGASALNTVALTGESLPREVSEEDYVLSGCVNVSGVLRVRVEKEFGESTASRIIDLVENASGKKASGERFITRFAKIYTPVVVALAVILAVAPPLFGMGPFAIWLYRALMFLVVSCPCALVISVPLTYFGGIGGASRSGILIKGASYMDVLSKLRTVVFDKTGTLTEGVFEVTAVHPELLDEKHLLHLAAHVERFSTHPIAAALRAAYPEESDDCEVGSIREIAGKGITAVINGKKVAVGNPALMDLEGAAWHNCHKSGTVIHVSVDGVYAGHIVISDRVKADAAEAVAALRAAGVRRTVMLTGDNEATAASVAAETGVDEYRSGLLPDGKVAAVEALMGLPADDPSNGAPTSGTTSLRGDSLTSGTSSLRGNSPTSGTSSLRADSPTSGTLAFVGDGINDAPVLARADVGIAMGGLGSDAAIEAADVVVMDDKPGKVALALRIARRTLCIARENIWFAIGVKALVLVLAAIGVATMWMAVFADVGVTVLAVLNAMRALRVPRSR